MKIIRCLLSFSPLFFAQQLTAMDIQKTTNINDTIRLHYNDTITFQSLTLTWKSYVIEDIVESNGAPGGQGISIGIAFKRKEKEDIWVVTMPVPYKEFIQTQPDKVTYAFEGYTVFITQANLNSNPKDFLMLSVAKSATNTTTYFINNKQVNETDFTNFLKQLKEVPGTWSCAETRGGGIVRYEVKDSRGKVYHFTSAVENGISRNSLMQEVPLSF